MCDRSTVPGGSAEIAALQVGFRRPRGGGSGDPGGAGRGIRTVPMDLTGDAAWHVPEESAVPGCVRIHSGNMASRCTGTHTAKNCSRR